MLIDIINKTKITKHIIIGIFIGSGLFFSILYFGPVWYEYAKAVVLDSRGTLENYSKRQLVVGPVAFNAYVSDTEEKRKQGLSGQTLLGSKEAMLFIFKEEGLHSIWMKDMNFAIDIIWVNKFNEVIYIIENASPDGYKKNPPEVFRPKSDAIYVIEVKAGTVKKEGIKLGDSVSIL